MVGEIFQAGREGGFQDVTGTIDFSGGLFPLMQGLYEKALEDSEKALVLDKENIRALFRKARSLNELGRHKEAYECNSRCLLSLPHVSPPNL